MSYGTTSVIQQIYEALSDEELINCMEEIIEFQKTGFVKDDNSKCREIQAKLEEIIGKNNAQTLDYSLRNLLNEMAMRWYKIKQSSAQETL